jgi:hypothetical protein
MIPIILIHLFSDGTANKGTGDGADYNGGSASCTLANLIAYDTTRYASKNGTRISFGHIFAACQKHDRGQENNDQSCKHG